MGTGKTVAFGEYHEGRDARNRENTAGKLVEKHSLSGRQYGSGGGRNLFLSWGVPGGAGIQ